MNAVSPSGLKKPKSSQSTPDDTEEVRLTMDSDDADIDALSGSTFDGGFATGANADFLQGSMPPQLADIEVTLSVEVGSRTVALRDLLSVSPGQLFTLDQMTNDPVTVLVNGRPFAKGEVVAIENSFGVRLLSILPKGGL